MKKILLALLVCLLLTACGSRQGNAETTQLTTAPPAVELYYPGSAVEHNTKGAVLVYELDTNNCSGLLSMGDKLVLVESTKLTLLQGDKCEVVAQLDTIGDLSASYMSIDASDTGIAYYEKANNQLILLNPRLQQSAAYTLPETLQGKPAISLSKQQAFYCEGKELRALNLQTGISRLLRTFTEETVELTGIYFEGAVLRCEVIADGNAQVMYLSTENGQTLSEDVDLFHLQTKGEDYFAMRTDGPVIQRIFGTMNEEAKSLNVDNVDGNFVAVLPLNGVINYISDEIGLHLSFYDLNSGLRTSFVTLNEVSDPAIWHADEQYIWLVAVENERKVLYRWDVSASPVQDDVAYTGKLYTPQKPDVAGLENLKKRVDTMNDTYGLRISIWEDAVKTSGSYTFVPEHNVPALSARLDELEAGLTQFPPKFLEYTVEKGWVQICLVRSIESGEEFVQYWSGGDCYGAISMDADITEAFLLCTAYGIDSHVIGNSRDFDTWDKLNPSGFKYGQEADDSLLAGEGRAFVDAEAMKNPHEDRSRIIAYAMMDGNEEMFTSEIMQKKLLRACEGIREAYGLEKSKETYLWEQYLNKSLAYNR